jgi:hypothetical protein
MSDDVTKIQRRADNAQSQVSYMVSEIARTTGVEVESPSEAVASVRVLKMAADLAYERKAEIDRLRAAVDAALALHDAYTIKVTALDECALEECDHDNDCPTRPFEVCRTCWAIADLASNGYYGENGINEGLMHPCPTRRALAPVADPDPHTTSDEETT